MNESIFKRFSTEQLLEHVVNVINEFMEMPKTPENKQAVEQKKQELLLIHKELKSRNDYQPAEVKP